MYKNQYLISSQTATCPPPFPSREFEGLVVYAHPSLNVSMVRNDAAHVLMLGHALDPEFPNETEQDILNRIVERGESTDLMFRQVQRLTGRFILLYRNEFEFVAMHDACALRQINYSLTGDELVLTSSLRMYLDLFDSNAKISESTRAFVELDEYQERQFAWYGDDCLDIRFKCLLPNFYLDILKRERRRLRLFYEDVPDSDPMEYVANTLQGTFQALARRHQLVQPLTAGWDTRILLAAARSVHQDISFYVFQKKNADEADARISLKLAKRLGLNHHVIQLEELTTGFLELYRREHVIPRILPATRNIQYHYFENADRGVINVNGNCAEIGRCVYGRMGRGITPKMLRVFSGYGAENRLVNRAIQDWFDEARHFCGEFGIPILDLFYWEQRMGRWGSQYPQEQDIAIEEIAPFNNRNLLLSILQVPPRERIAPNHVFFHRLLKKLWPEVLAEPINPGGPAAYLKKVLKGHSASRYYTSIMKQTFIR